MSEGASPLEVLMLEDSPLDAELIDEHLQRGGVKHVAIRVSSRDEFITALDSKRFNLILADYNLPSFDGLTALKIAIEKAPDTPFILVSGTLGEEAAIDAMRNGANDYVVKQRLTRLPDAVRRAVGEVNERRARREAEEGRDQANLSLARTMDDLRRREEQLRLATEMSDIGLWDVDVVKDTLFWDANCKAMFGISPDVEVTLADFYAGLHPADLAATTEAFAASLDPSARAKYDVEYRTVGKEDGAIRWVAAKGQGIFDDAGRCVRATGTTLDITAQKIASLHREARVRISEVLANSIDAATISSRVGHVLGEVLGVSRVGYATLKEDAATIDEGWHLSTVQDVTGTIDLRQFGSFVDDIRAGRDVIISDVKSDRRTSDRSDSLAAYGVRSLVNVPIVESGKAVAMLFVNHTEPRVWSNEEISLVKDAAHRVRVAVERRRAENALSALASSLEDQVKERTAERNLLAKVFESTDSLINVLDVDFRWLALNKAAAEGFEAAFGVRPKVGDRLLDLIDGEPDQRILAEALWSRALAGEEFTAIQKFGGAGRQSVTYEIKFNNLRDETGELVGAYQIVTNINDRVAAEEQLMETQQALRQAQKMEAVGQLTGGIAHDFNNMLAVVIGSLELIKRRIGSEDARMHGFIDAAIEGSKRATNLTQRLLAFSRQQPLNPKTLDVNKLVVNMTELLKHSIGADIRLETSLTGEPWRVHADPNQLENVILNLAVNARDAMPTGGTLEIVTRNVGKGMPEDNSPTKILNGDFVLISVSDTGSGMPAEVIEKAFDPFFTTKDVGKGTGLGLSQVYGFVNQSGGHVRIQSEVGKGTTINIYLRRDLNDESEAKISGSSDPHEGRGEELILVVDDEPAVRRFTCEALTELGYGVVEAGDAAQALSALKNRPDIALLLTDILMPEVNGFDLAKQGREVRSDLKVLFSSGYTRNSTVQGQTLDPNLELISKPFTIDELATKVRAVLEKV